MLDVLMGAYIGCLSSTWACTEHMHWFALCGKHTGSIDMESACHFVASGDLKRSSGFWVEVLNESRSLSGV